ncbi:hypothetical protein SAMN05660831_02107 [Thiohalospira halophila DSM 15071]|uniref:Uncharacterized protein n=1 Tax=Thiohalospira halophila DSM 15071 TaxID=1123397 RepID=A0A1I1UKJ8_9GAMM|nr:hypothetical protein [Thiohalospira halophila]SFD68490.1 hypothetical protein SAMN05660831_02107 [Thiohalospira halophila DSM 15071]
MADMNDKRNQPQTYIALRPFRDKRTGEVVPKDAEVQMSRREAAHLEGSRLQLKGKGGGNKSATKTAKTAEAPTEKAEGSTDE